MLDMESLAKITWNPSQKLRRKAESRPSSATHSAPSGAAFVSANSAAPFPVRE